eukprot:gene2998-3186_t
MTVTGTCDCDDDRGFPLPTSESQRLKILRQTELLDSKEEESYDRYTSMAVRLFHVPCSFLNLVDVDRLNVKSRCGIDWKGGPRKGAFCGHAILDDSPPVFIVRDTLKDPRFIDSPYVVNPPHYRFYAGASITIEGQKIGTLCLLDVKPLSEERFGEREALILQDLACIVGNLIRTRREEKLSNIYESLMMNADILKLYRIPLQNVMECKKSVEKVYRKTVASSRSLRSSGLFTSCLQTLSEEIGKLSFQVRRFLLISSKLIALIAEIYQLEAFDFLTDLSGVLPFQRNMKPENNDSTRIFFRTLTKMTLAEVQSEVQQLIGDTESNGDDDTDAESSQMKIHWLTDNLLPFDSSGSIYSYPTLLQIILMILYDAFDSWGERAEVSITSKVKRNQDRSGHNDRNKDRKTILRGHWSIAIQTSDQSKMDRDLLKNMFTIFEKISSCRHYAIHTSAEAEESKDQEDLRPESGSSKTQGLLNEIYRIEIPFYLFQVLNDQGNNHNVDNIFIDNKSSQATNDIPLNFGTPSRSLHNVLEIEKEEAKDLPLHLSIKQKPVMTSKIESSFRSLQQQWRSYALSFFQTSKHKVYSCRVSNSHDDEDNDYTITLK